MEFGKLSDVTAVDFGLPPDHESNDRVLAGARAADPTLLVGLAGWSDRGFAGVLSPPGTGSGEFLRHYARAFPTNELNSTYYGVAAERIARWTSSVPPGFRFCPKLPQLITHDRWLRGVDAEMERFVTALAGFGAACGRAWAVLPPGFDPAAARDLEHFVRAWAPRVPLAIELRHPAWFRGGRAAERAFAVFESCGVVPILTDVAGRRDVLHMRVTGPEVMLRFVGNHPHESDRRRLDAWVDRLAGWFERGLGTAYVFLHQPHDPDAVGSARHFARRWRDRTGQDPLPGLDAAMAHPRQGELF